MEYANFLKQKLDSAQTVEVNFVGSKKKLVYDCSFESALLNIGNYDGMANVGG
jgi:hypothetical protein